MATIAKVNPDCEACLRRHTAAIQAACAIEPSSQVRRGDLVIVSDEGERTFDLVLCNGVDWPCSLKRSAEFARLLERVRNGDHPAYGELGPGHSVMFTVQFDDKDGAASDEVVRRRAVRYMESFTEEERGIVDMEIGTRADLPVKATVRAKTGVFSAQRLRELSRRA